VDNWTVAVFAIVYMGMILGRLPGLALDRTGVALLGAIVLIAAGRLTTEQIPAAVDEATIALLFGLMIVSAQFRLSGFYSFLVRRLAIIRASPPILLALLIAVVGVLSAVLVNDVVCLAMTPVVIEMCSRRSWEVKPFLLGLACAANVGSAATLIGNPQNMLIGQVLHLSFWAFSVSAAVPVVLGLVTVWGIICLLTRGRWRHKTRTIRLEPPAFSSWQTMKGAAVVIGVMACFLWAPWPREMIALTAAGIILCSRQMRSREMLGLVDWQLLVLFLALFLVNHAMYTSGDLNRMLAFLETNGIDLHQPTWLFVVAVALSNLVSNVPAVMLLLPSVTHPSAGSILALASTLSGNLFIVGSVANIIVVDQAAKMGCIITWRDHARIGVPVTIATLAIAALWLWLV
jgi:Na+/H+ antiporter NhaD/arsenite permease-like protein